MSDVVLDVEIREHTGKGGARATRRAGLIPGVIYGGERGSIPISFKSNEVIRAMNAGKLLSQVINISHKGEKQQVITQDVQFDKLTDLPVHIDVYRVDDDQVIDVDVTVRFINDEKSPGIKRGGILNIVRHDVPLACKAAQIPEFVTVDLTGLEIGDAVHISAVKLPEGVVPAVDRDFTVATIVSSRASKAADAEGSDDAATDAGDGDDD